ncbi:MAG TPA: endolytic transglycosylase MltG [Candidatus Limnocylindrales bacterium]|nr:endolytic transglycosylase MltG [Candidatus Limnocylindrales bacterium]
MKRFVLFLLLLVLVAVAAAGLLRRELMAQVTLEAPVQLDVYPGEAADLIALRLQAAGVIRDHRLLLALARWKELDREFRHGRHEFQGTLGLEDVLQELVRTPKPILRVTIPEGLTYAEIGRLLEAAGAVSAADYAAAVCAPDYVAAVGAAPGANCAEGYLFPDTYDLVPGMTAREIADLQNRRFREVMEPVLAAASAGNVARQLAQSGGEAESALKSRLLTVASIVEKETAAPHERPLVAAVILNRLRLGMPLQVDPTVIYGWLAAGQPWDGNLTRRHLDHPNPYNTYAQRGLPPGPICNPGLASLQAATSPAEVPYLYFVARGDGSHEFSADLDSHNVAVKKFQLR